MVMKIKFLSKFKRQALLSIAFEQQGVYVAKRNLAKIISLIDYVEWDLAKKPNINNFDTYSTALNQIVSRNPFLKESYCVMSLPSSIFKLYSFEMPYMSNHEIKYSIDIDEVSFWKEFCPELVADAEEYKLAYYKIFDNKLDNTMYVVLSVVDKNIIDTYKNICQQLSLIPLLITDSHFLIWEYLRQHVPKTKTWHFLDLEIDKLSVHSIFENSHFVQALDINKDDKDLLENLKMGKDIDMYLLEGVFDRLLTQNNALINSLEKNINKSQTSIKNDVYFYSSIKAQKYSIAIIKASEGYSKKIKYMPKEEFSNEIKKSVAGIKNKNGLAAVLGGAFYGFSIFERNELNNLNFITYLNKLKKNLYIDASQSILKIMLFILILISGIHIALLAPKVLFNDIRLENFDKIKQQLSLKQDAQLNTNLSIKISENRQAQIREIKNSEATYQKFVMSFNSLVPDNMAIESIFYDSNKNNISIKASVINNKSIEYLLLALRKQPYVEKVILGKLSVVTDQSMSLTNFDVLIVLKNINK